MNDAEMRSLHIDYISRRFLDYIITLYRQNLSLLPFIADMFGDDNIRVRLGAMALVADKIKDKAVTLCRDRYKEFGPTHASEKLLTVHKIKVSDETLR